MQSSSRGSGPSDSVAWNVPGKTWTTTPAYTPRLVQEGARDIAYAGAWGLRVSERFAGGGVKAATGRGASATMVFTGRGVALVSTRGADRGEVAVYVDGAYAKTVDLQGSTSTRRIVWGMSWAKAGSHTVKLVVQGTPGHARVDLDALVVVK